MAEIGYFVIQCSAPIHFKLTGKHKQTRLQYRYCNDLKSKYVCVVLKPLLIGLFTFVVIKALKHLKILLTYK